MIGTLFSVGRLGFAAVAGVDEFVQAAARFGVKLALGVRKVDGEAGEEMVALMRSRVAVDTGQLLNGISSTTDENGAVTVQASAIKETGSGEDYAGYVERGTRAGVRGRKISYIADEGYFDLSAPQRRVGATYARSRRQARGHPGTPSQPFFFDSAAEVLARRGQSLDDAVTNAAAEADL